MTANTSNDKHMPFSPTGFPGLIVFEPSVFRDDRGYFFESYSEQQFHEQGLDIKFVQDNQSSSRFGVIRGLHYQLESHAQTKLVRVLQGSILDVAVDIRKGSPSYGKSLSIILSAENKKQLLIPTGFAHGFSVLSESAEILYKCDAFYHKASEGGILYNDPSLGIDWQVPESQVIVSPKDRELPLLAGCRNDFQFTGE
jgi:dTDP-4-dehydrorhamnose 3,5-epimerase